MKNNIPTLPSLDKIRIGWWNTNISPPIKGTPPPLEDGDLIIEVIITLLFKCDILFLGEVSSENMDWINEKLSGTTFIIKNMTIGGKSSIFNFGVIYNSEVSHFHGSEFLIDTIAGANYKISCRMDFLLHNEFNFSFLVSHWPSRLRKPEDSSSRGHYATALRRYVDSALERGTQYIIVLGDFNDEPFNESMTTYLRGCRDAAFVNTHPQLLYNPFWKRIACTKGYTRAFDQTEPTGTYFYRSDNLHRWRVLDQMLFCAAFVGRSKWHLNETETGVLRYERLVQAIESTKSKLDHLPILAELNKEPTDG
ncbi:endonuclease/exonuclease/phosphatase family protein [Hoeflea ulvae]|uniref:Endonuclease/exonuclease/phosphatase family protein n=1 Tax=Hoeflea ulvae TaxID=2983764 RepID=A0ABT3YDA5_9HYPH|nr:endonuclease/exonuclease/phosphatase family protein [Hoeflea ulvae]MCY0093861.1 endonuclease/exonuclease/phosphatase family protein [Hoeflea ulvae]